MALKMIVDMDSDALKKLEKTLRPGGASASGFYGKNEDILALARRDDAWVQGNKTTHAALADRLMNFLKSLPASWDAPKGGDCHNQCLGHQSCPFGCRDYGSHHYYFTFKGKKYSCGSLLVHLIREHGCYEGEEIPPNDYDKKGGMRVPPEVCAELPN
jgi:hypothetical protein